MSLEETSLIDNLPNHTNLSVDTGYINAGRSTLIQPDYQNINIAKDADTPDEPTYQYYIPGQGLVSSNLVTMPTEHIAEEAGLDTPTHQYYIPKSAYVELHFDDSVVPTKTDRTSSSDYTQINFEDMKIIKRYKTRNILFYLPMSISSIHKKN